jgi:hypothetical protein
VLDRDGHPLPLQPRTPSELLDGAFTLLRAHARVIVLVSAGFIVPVQVAAAFLSRDVLGGAGLLEIFQDPSTTQAALDARGTGATGAFLLGAAARALVMPALAGAVSVVAARSLLGGEVSVGAALRTALRRWPALVVAWVLVHIAELFASIFLFLPGLLVMALFVPVAPVIAVEGLGPFRALGRSARLVSSRLFPVMGVAIVSGVLASAVNTSLGVVPQTISYLVGLDRGWVLLAASTTITSLIVSPWIALVAALVYFDGRVRHEGLDLQVRAAQMAVGSTA